MSYTYANRKKTDGARQKETAAQGPSLDELRAGSAAPSAEQMGHRVDLPDAMREKMESAFGADLSAVKLYESDAVREAGAEAVTQGSNIAFAPGMLDFTSYGGQALLGHEISHVVSQARGEVTGSGLLNDHALEARADREGAMAAAGQQISVPAAAMSPVSAAAASGPMQCKSKRASNRKIDELHRIGSGMYAGADVSSEDYDFYNTNIRSLTDDEVDMIAKRNRDTIRGQYSDYTSMVKKSGRRGNPSVDDGGVARASATSKYATDRDIYSTMLRRYSEGLSGDQQEAYSQRMQKIYTDDDMAKAQKLLKKVSKHRHLKGGNFGEMQEEAMDRMRRHYYGI